MYLQFIMNPIINIHYVSHNSLMYPICHYVSHNILMYPIIHWTLVSHYSLAQCIMAIIGNLHQIIHWNSTKKKKKKLGMH